MSAPPLLPAPTVSVVLRASTWPNAFRTLMALTRAGSRALRLETIVIDDGSADETRLALPRLDGVVVQRNETPVGVARARNQGAALAQGELLFFVAEGAEAEPGALAELVRALDTDAAATVAGSSLLTADGSAYRPDLSFEEPGADGETLAAREVVVLPPEALLVRADAFRDAGGFGEAFTAGGEAADLCLRLRQRGGRALRVTGSIMRCRPEPIPAALAAQDEATLLQRWPDVFAPSRAAAAMPAPPPGAGAPLVSIVVPAWNKWEYTYRCLLSLLRNTSGAAFETLVVDNGSTDETAVALPQLEGIRVLRNAENLGFARACNQGAAAARGRHLLFLNNDIEALPGWLPAMLTKVTSFSGSSPHCFNANLEP